MPRLLDRVKECVPRAARTRLRKWLAHVPLASKLARVRLAPWRVGFMIGGAMKGGTTALCSFLDCHPEICMASGKEAHFFDTEANFVPGQAPDYAPFHARFSPCVGTRLLGDATPITLYWEPAAARAMAYNSRMKWVLLLRQPVERAYSHWNMVRQTGEEPLSFAEAVAAEPERITTDRGRRLFSYLDRGFYAGQLRRLFAVVPRRQVLVMRSEELRHDHAGTLRRVFAFLGVDPGVAIEPDVIHARDYEAPLPATLKRDLTAHFADDIRDLEDLLGWDLRAWQSP